MAKYLMISLIVILFIYEFGYYLAERQTFMKFFGRKDVSKGGKIQLKITVYHNHKHNQMVEFVYDYADQLIDCYLHENREQAYEIIRRKNFDPIYSSISKSELEHKINYCTNIWLNRSSIANKDKS